MADWYDHPQYFDMVFRDETAAEIAFLEDAFERYATRPVRKLLEPGCGSGRLVADLAALDYEVTGLDLSEPMLKYLARRLKRRQLSANLKLGDMTQISIPGRHWHRFRRRKRGQRPFATKASSMSLAVVVPTSS